MFKRVISQTAIASFLAAALLSVIPAAVAHASTPRSNQLTEAACNATWGCQMSCKATDNLEYTANDFISRCRQGSIRRELPGQFYGSTLAEILAGKTAEHKKAWKLLNDGRFVK